MNKSLIVSIVFLIALVIGGFVFHHSNKPIVTTSSPKDTADFILENVTAIETNEDGTLKEKIEAPRVTHFQDNHSLFDRPHFIITKADGAKWDIHAQHGRANKGFDNVVLWGKVVVIQLADKKHDATRLTTERLVIYPNRKIPLSKPVRF